MLGMSLPVFTLVHILLSLAGIAAGFGVLYGLLQSRESASWTGAFLALTTLTSLTGYLFPFERVLPSHVVGAISLVALAVAAAALYLFRLAGAWRWIYVVSAVAALYLNTFVLVVQTFVKNPALKEVAPTQSEPLFLVVQALLLAAFVALGALAVRRFHPEAAALPQLRTA